MRLSMPSSVAISLFLGLSFASGLARANPCGADGSCQAGYHCEERPVPGMCPSCPSENCPPCTPATTTKTCVVDRIGCESDADCPGYLVCEQTTGQASCPGCPEPAPLPKKETHTCLFRERSCSQESDCADGLRCLPSTSSTCEGSGTAPPACTPEPWSLCSFQAIVCATTTDCPYDFTCELVETTCNAPDCPLGSVRVCRPRGVGFGATPDGKNVYSDVFSTSNDPRPPVAADGRGNTASVAPKKAGPGASGQTPSAGSADQGPAASDPGCALASAPAGGALPSLVASALALIGLAARRRRSVS